MSSCSPMLDLIEDEFGTNVDVVDDVDVTHITVRDEITEAAKRDDRIPDDANRSPFFLKNWEWFCGIAGLDRQALRQAAAKRQRMSSGA